MPQFGGVKTTMSGHDISNQTNFAIYECTPQLTPLLYSEYSLEEKEDKDKEERNIYFH